MGLGSWLPLNFLSGFFVGCLDLNHWENDLQSKLWIMGFS